MMSHKPIAAGKSSFDLIDAERLFAELNLQDVCLLVDIACGRGNYALAAAQRMVSGGSIVAVDLWQEGIDQLNGEIESKGINNICTAVADVSKHIPVEDGGADCCLMATVVHDLIEDGTGDGALREVRRILSSEGRLAIVEFEKVEGPPGPPIGVRLSPQELEAYLVPFGFCLTNTSSIGEFHYLSVFKHKAGNE